MNKTSKQNPLLAHLETLHRQSNACGVWTEPKCIRAKLNSFPKKCITNHACEKAGHTTRVNRRSRAQDKDANRRRQVVGVSFQGRNPLTPKHTTVPGGTSTGLHMSPRDPHSKCTSVSPIYLINHPPHYWYGRHVQARHSFKTMEPSTLIRGWHHLYIAPRGIEPGLDESIPMLIRDYPKGRNLW